MVEGGLVTKETKQDKGAQIMLNRGFEEIPGKSKKYRVFKNPKRDILYFIGKRGAIRAGKNVSSSYSIGNVR